MISSTKNYSRKSLIEKALEIGEKSGFVENFNRNKFLKDIHNKYLSK
jgi:hypothetical protein